MKTVYNLLGRVSFIVLVSNAVALATYFLLSRTAHSLNDILQASQYTHDAFIFTIVAMSAFMLINLLKGPVVKLYEGLMEDHNEDFVYNQPATPFQLEKEASLERIKFNRASKKIEVTEPKHPGKVKKASKKARLPKNLSIPVRLS